MQPNFIIIGVVIILGIFLVVYLVRRNLKDEKETIDHFNNQSSLFKDDESEFNDEQ